MSYELRVRGAQRARRGACRRTTTRVGLQRRVSKTGGAGELGRAGGRWARHHREDKLDNGDMQAKFSKTRCPYPRVQALNAGYPA